MKKGIYRSVEIKDVQLEWLSQQLPLAKAAFGVDVAKVEFKGAFLKDSGVLAQSIRWKSPVDVSALIGLLSELGGPGRIEVALEPSGTYGDCLVARLRAEDYAVYRVSPKHTHDAAELFDGVPSKHDVKDAAIIARLHQLGRSHRWEEETEQQRDLGAAMEILDVHQQQVLRNVGRLEAKLARHWPELPKILELDSATLLALLKEFGGPDQVAAKPVEAEKMMAQVGGRFLAKSKRQQLIDAARTTIGVKMTSGERRTLSELAREANHNRQEVKAAEAVVEGLVKDNPRVQRMATVIGKVTAASLEVGLGSAEDYENSAAYVKAAGLNLKERSSGTHKGQWKIAKRGPSLVRRNLFLAALRLIQREPLFKAWHAAKVARMGGKDKMKSVVALMRKLLGALWHVSRGSEFDAGKLFDVRMLADTPS